jgi:molybdenum-dependent DNA-binding transcriptional regulator ModE
MNGFKDQQEIAEYRRKLAEVQEQIEALLADGTESAAKHEAFMKEHKIQPGSGKKNLLGPGVSSQVRVITSRLMEEYDMMEERLQNYEKANSGKSVPIAARALGNRYRI